jgi:hypothetical protein
VTAADPGWAKPRRRHRFSLLPPEEQRAEYEGRLNVPEPRDPQARNWWAGLTETERREHEAAGAARPPAGAPQPWDDATFGQYARRFEYFTPGQHLWAMRSRGLDVICTDPETLQATAEIHVRYLRERAAGRSGQDEAPPRGKDPRRAREDQLARDAVFGHYGRACACCGSAENLVIDHVAGGGAAHRIELNLVSGGVRFYRWLIAQGFPDGYQALCSRCNSSKGEGTACRLDHAAGVTA